MGHAPKWCAFLENLTEEMEESNSTTLYDDFKFLTPAELDKLNASHLIGTPMLKAYMHGFFMDLRAYQKLISIADPFAYEKFRQEQIANRMNKQRERIQVKKSTNGDRVKVNQQFVDELLQKKKGASELIADDRFKSLFEDKEFTRTEAESRLKPVSISSSFLTLWLGFEGRFK